MAMGINEAWQHHFPFTVNNLVDMMIIGLNIQRQHLAFFYNHIGKAYALASFIKGVALNVIDQGGSVAVG